jgi:hypothetical protein
VSVAHRLTRITVVCAVACALLLAVTSAARAQEQPTWPEQQQYYVSHGEPESLSRPGSPATPDDTPLLPIALVVAGSLAAVVAARRIRIRRRAGHVAA